MTKPLVGIIGPLTDGGEHGVLHRLDNARRAMEAAEQVVAAGGIPYIPHLNMYYHYAFPHDEPFWRECALAVLKKCGLIYDYAPDVDSVGLTAERKALNDEGLPMYTTLTSLRTHLEIYNELQTRDYLLTAHTSEASLACPAFQHEATPLSPVEESSHQSRQLYHSDSPEPEERHQ